MTQSLAMDWKSFTELFEGDGPVSVRLGRAKNRVLQICIVVGQKWKPKLDQIDNFLRGVKIDSGRIYAQKYGYTLRVFKISAVKVVLGDIIPYSYLKREQASAALAYLDGEITGDESTAIYPREYELGKRRSMPPAVSAPLTNLELRTPSPARLRLGRTAIGRGA